MRGSRILMGDDDLINTSAKYSPQRLLMDGHDMIEFPASAKHLSNHKIHSSGL
jgi:hypothetical protein